MQYTLSHLQRIISGSTEQPYYLVAEHGIISHMGNILQLGQCGGMISLDFIDWEQNLKATLTMHSYYKTEVNARWISVLWHGLMEDESVFLDMVFINTEHLIHLSQSCRTNNSSTESEEKYVTLCLHVAYGFVLFTKGTSLHML